MDAPLVTVICLCHNQDQFVREAIESVFQQTHPNIQLIVVDDASTDRSREVIQGVLHHHPEVVFLSLKENLGNCKAFNRGLALAKGEYIIDLAADDELKANRIEAGIKALREAGERYGVHFSDAERIDENGKFLDLHSNRFPHDSIPQGDIYRDVIERYFICSPTMMMRKSVLEKLGGYDESLAYEDFDFWIRSSREFNYCYSPEVLARRRMVGTSMSKKQYHSKSPQLYSTYLVCCRIFQLNHNQSENKALARRIRYEMRKVLELGEWSLAYDYLRLWFKTWR